LSKHDGIQIIGDKKPSLARQAGLAGHVKKAGRLRSEERLKAEGVKLVSGEW
jgi:hypothetical protein